MKWNEDFDEVIGQIEDGEEDDDGKVYTHFQFYGVYHGQKSNKLRVIRLNYSELKIVYF